MARKSWLTIGVVSICVLLALACLTPCLTGLFAAARPSSQPTPLPTIAQSEDAATRFHEKAQEMKGESFTVEFTDDEVTSYLALHSAASLPLASPQVSFQPGRVIITGDLTRPIRGHVTLTGTVQVAGGRFRIEFEDAKVGAMPIPQALLASLSDGASQLIIETEAEIEIERIELLQGRMRIAGHRRTP